MVKRIVQITDTHLGDRSAIERGIDPRQNLLAILEAVAADAVDELIFTGDIGEKEQYRWFFDKIEEYKPGFRIVLGNHDDYSEAARYFTTYKTAGQGELYYSNEDEFYKYVFLDSSSAAISPAQLQWLAREIITIKKIIIFVHHPILGIPTGIDNQYPLHNRDEVVQMLRSCKQEINIFCGHYHMPDKRSLGKIHQYVTPAVSFQVRKFSPALEVKADSFGYRIIIISEHSVKSKLIINGYD